MTVCEKDGMKEKNNVLIGDPYRFAVLIASVEEWSTAYNCGFCSLCLDGKLFPDIIINAIIPSSIYEIKESLMNIPNNKMIYDMDAKKLFNTLYELVYPDVDSDVDNDYRYELSTHEMVDDNYFVFAVESEGMIKILAAKSNYYNCKESNYVFDNDSITEVVVEKDYINKIISELENELKITN